MLDLARKVHQGVSVMAQFNVEDQTGNHPWKNHDGKGDQGKDERQMKAANIAIRPKTRIRRSMTACNTCRKLKTRCDLEPRSHACRRCLSLRFDIPILSSDQLREKY